MRSLHFSRRSNFFLPEGRNVPPSHEAFRFCADAKAGQTPRAWHGTIYRAGCCRSNGGWPVADPGRRKTARSRRLWLPHTVLGLSSPERALWIGAWRAHRGISKIYPLCVGIQGWQKAWWGWRKNLPVCNMPAVMGLCQASWKTQACRCSSSHRPSYYPQNLFLTTGGSEIWVREKEW